MSEVVTCNGAQEGFYQILAAHCQPGWSENQRLHHNVLLEDTGGWCGPPPPLRNGNEAALPCPRDTVACYTLVSADASLSLSIDDVITFEGDEVVCIEPCFDSPWKIADQVGAVRKGVPLRPRNGVRAATAGDLVLDLDELDAALRGSSARILVLNTPHNPTGKWLLEVPPTRFRVPPSHVSRWHRRIAPRTAYLTLTQHPTPRTPRVLGTR